MARLRSLLGSMYVWWAVCALCAGISAWADRFRMDTDGLSYLDMGSEAVTTGLGRLVNAYWSPVYPAFIGSGLFLFKPSARFEFPVVHIVNFVIFLLVLSSFTYFFKAWRASRQVEDDEYLIPLGFGLFLWFISECIPVGLVTPDLVVAGIAFLAAGACCRASLPGSNWKSYIVLGAILGLGYYVKTAVLLLGLMLLAILFCWPARNIRRGGILLSAVVFLALSAPWIAVISNRAGHLSIGESGRLTYAWFVNHLQSDGDWTGKSGDYPGTPIHPPRTLFDNPFTIEFATPATGTFPLWYDPAYWYAGASPRFSIKEQIVAVIKNLRIFAEAAIPMSSLFAGFLGLWLLLGERIPKPDRVSSWLLLWPVSAGLMYSLIHVDVRFLGAFFVMFWLAAYGLVLPRINAAARTAVLTAVLVTLFMQGAIGFAVRAIIDPIEPDHVVVSDALRSFGVTSGDRVAVVGLGYRAYYARLAGARVVAEVVDADQFWRLSAPEAAKITERLAGLGAKALVAINRPSTAAAGAWRDIPVPGTRRFSILLLGPA